MNSLKQENDGQAAPSFMSNKALCASWAEAFAYTGDEAQLKYGDNVVNHHSEARRIVSEDKALKRECRDIAFQLAQCLRGKKLF